VNVRVNLKKIGLPSTQDLLGIGWPKVFEKLFGDFD